MKTKKEQAIELYKVNPIKALRFCKKWHDLGKHKNEIIIGAECTNNAAFYEQIGVDCDVAVSLAIKYLGQHLGVLDSPATNI